MLAKMKLKGKHTFNHWHAGLSERDIFDLASVAGFFNMTNRVASAIAMAPNPEYHGQHR